MADVALGQKQSCFAGIWFARDLAESGPASQSSICFQRVFSANVEIFPSRRFKNRYGFIPWGDSFVGGLTNQLSFSASVVLIAISNAAAGLNFGHGHVLAAHGHFNAAAKTI